MNAGSIIAVVCPKGGVGKTTIAVNLASSLAARGRRGLLVGVDPQCGLTGSFGRDRFEIDFGLPELFSVGGHSDRAIVPSGVENLDFIASNIWSREEEDDLLTRAAIEPENLSLALNALRPDRDFLILDCPPNLGPLTFAALQAADHLLVPLQAEELAWRALPRLFEALDEMDARQLRPPKPLGIVLNQVDPRTRLSRSIQQKAGEKYGDLVCRTIIPRSVRLAEVAQRGRPVDHFNRSGMAAAAFSALAEELLDRIRVAELEAEASPQLVKESDPELPVLTRLMQNPPEEPAQQIGEDPQVWIDKLLAESDPSPTEEAFISLEMLEEEETAAQSRSNLDDYDGE